MNLFDLVRQAGGGQAFPTLGAHLGWSDDQIARAVEAFLPAFSAGLKRSTADPLGFAELMRRLATGGYPAAYRDPTWGFGPGAAKGQDALAFLFGSPAAAEALARQASAFTGLAQDKMAALLPAMASLLFGGLAGPAVHANPFLDRMMNAMSGSAPQARGPASGAKGPLDRYEDEAADRERRDRDMGRAGSDMMRAGLAAFESGATAWTDAVGGLFKTPQPDGTAPGRDLFGDFFEPGRRLGEAYQREIDAVLDRFAPGTRRS